MKSVLIVEDEALTALDLSWFIQSLGYEVVGPVESAADALSLAAQAQPDLVLMDVRIRGRPDGIATAARLRDEGPVRVIFITANTDPQTRARAEALNPVAILAKPYTAEQVNRALRAALEQAD